MIDFKTMLNLQMMLFLLILIGIYARKKEIITDSTRKNLSDLLIKVILPCNIISSFNVNLTIELIIQSVKVLIISFGIQFLCIFFSKILYIKVEHRKQMILKYATICSNCGFMGLPVAYGVYGTQGLLYASIALIPVRIFMWSAGLSLFTETNKKTMIKALLIHPCIIAVYIGFIILFSRVQLPQFLQKTIESVGNCNSAVSMIIIGAILAEIDVKTVISKLTMYYSFVRLIFIPLIVLIILKSFRLESMIIGVSIIMTAMPAGSTTAILASQYGCDFKFASKCIFASTMLSLITIPIIGMLL